MAKYKPSTVDDSNAVARRMRSQRRALESALTPGKTQVYQTTDKVEGMDLTGLGNRLEALEEKTQPIPDGYILAL